MTLPEALAALDRAVTLVTPEQARRTQREQWWCGAGDQALELFATGEQIYRLSDGGDSAVTYSMIDRWCMLTRGSSSPVRERFEDALSQRRAIEAMLQHWLERQ